MLIDEEQLKRASGYKRRADLVAWVKRNARDLKLLAPGCGGTVSAIPVLDKAKQKEPDFARLAAKGDD